MSIEGIFRKSGNIRRLKDLTDAIDRDASSVDLTTDNPVQLAALLKKFLRELPDPLMTFKLYRLLTATQCMLWFLFPPALRVDIISALDGPEKRRQLRFVSMLLPKSHRDTLEVIFVFLKFVASFAHMGEGHPDEETGSKMDLGNLAIVIAPSILYSQGRDAVRDDQFGAIDVITELLEEQDDFLSVPPELMPILKDQELFVNLTELPSKEFLKKCDTYMKGKQGNGPSRPAPPMSHYTNGSGTGRMQTLAPERPPLGSMSPSERPVRNQTHPGLPAGSMSFPPPGSPATPIAQLQGQHAPPLRPALPEEQSWSPPIPRMPNPTGSPSSRPTSYVQPRSVPQSSGIPSDLPYS